MNLLDEIRERSKTKLVICFVGVGSAFAKKNAQTSMIIGFYGKLMLVDCGTTIPIEFYKKGLDLLGFDYYYITHSHSDHIGGLEELLLMARYVRKIKPKFIITQNYQQTLWNSSLQGGLEINEDGLLRFSDYIEPIRPEWIDASPRERYKITLWGMPFEFFRTYHVPGDVQNWDKAFWSTGVKIDDKVLFTADTRFDKTLFDDMCGGEGRWPKAIFHDVQLFNPGPVHATYDELKTLSGDYKEIMYLTHYGDNFEKFDPVSDGFKGFAEPWKIYEF
jgi:hypothetical protein